MEDFETHMHSAKITYVGLWVKCLELSVSLPQKNHLLDYIFKEGRTLMYVFCETPQYG